jgi:hypothetical protein
MDAFAQEMRLVKRALLDWQVKHAGRCEMVMLTVSSTPEHHPAIASLIEQVYRDEAELGPLLQSLSVRVALLNERGEPMEEYALGEPTAANPAKRKPWWQFW